MNRSSPAGSEETSVTSSGEESVINISASGAKPMQGSLFFHEPVTLKSASAVRITANETRALAPFPPHIGRAPTHCASHAPPATANISAASPACASRSTV